MVNTTPVAIYGRVASGSQLALDAQIECLKAYASERNMDVISVYSDIAPAGKTQDALQRLLLDAEGRAFEKVLVLKPSRLARETSALLDITTRLQQAGATVEYADGSAPMIETVYQRLIS
jgi:DNA invertase Pin-like site-specific DNA recombinase